MKLTKNKKIILGVIGAVALGTLSSLSLVSCSGNKIPSIDRATELIVGSKTLKYSNGAFRCVTGNINGFQSMPAIDSKNVTTYDARNKFYAYELFTTWLISFSNLIQNLLENYTLESLNNSAINLTASQLQLGVALSTPLNQGNDTIRYGLQSISIAEPSWPSFTSYIDASASSAPIVNIGFRSIQLTFNWWNTSNGSDVNWMNDSFNPESQLANSANWNIWTEKGVKPPKKMTISFSQAVNLSLIGQVVDNKSTGLFSEYTKDGTMVTIGGLNNQQTKQNLDLLDESYKVTHGDVNNVQFSDFYNEHKEQLNTILSWFSF